VKGLANKILLLAVTVMTFLAGIASASACGLAQYQPEVPESLRK
jgi:cyclic lactone autoinducer peptide